MVVGIGKGCIRSSRFVIFLQGFLGELLIVVNIYTGFLGAIVDDVFLQVYLCRVSQGLAYQRILCLCENGDDSCLLVDGHLDVVPDDAGNVKVWFRQIIGVEFLLAAGIFFGFTLCPPKEEVENFCPPRILTVFSQVGRIIGVNLPIGTLHVDFEKTIHKLVVFHQVGIEQGGNGV